MGEVVDVEAGNDVVEVMLVVVVVELSTKNIKEVPRVPCTHVRVV